MLGIFQYKALSKCFFLLLLRPSISPWQCPTIATGLLCTINTHTHNTAGPQANEILKCGASLVAARTNIISACTFCQWVPVILALSDVCRQGVRVSFDTKGLPDRSALISPAHTHTRPQTHTRTHARTHTHHTVAGEWHKR